LSRAERHGELARIEEARAAREAVRRRREEAVADLAVRAWNRARPVETHPYLARKGTGAHDLRQNRSGHLLVPMRDADGRLWGIQTIDAAGTKRFMGGGRKQGLFAALGTPGPGEPVVIAEGYVTAAALREATGLATIAAFDSGNLLDVARAVREREPARRVVIAADNDHQLPRRVVPLPNVGLEKATAAAEAVGGVVLSPAFASGDKGTDWNDYSVQHGREALRVATQTTLRAHGMALPSGPRAARTDQTTVMSAAPTQADRDAARQRLQGGAGTGATEAAAREAARQAQRERAPRARP
jgi:putative DNA primase/helicase